MYSLGIWSSIRFDLMEQLDSHPYEEDNCLHLPTVRNGVKIDAYLSIRIDSRLLDSHLLLPEGAAENRDRALFHCADTDRAMLGVTMVDPENWTAR